MQRKELSLKELQLESMAILKDVHTFCSEHGIMYSVAYGTLIGTIRHKGFIPWDDDIDIIMPRPDYDRFCKTYSSDDYKIKSPEMDSDCMLGFARIYDDSRTITDSIVPWNVDKTGVWIDVFPADSVPDDKNFNNTDTYQFAIDSWRKSVTARTALGHFRKEKSFVFNFKLAIKKVCFKNGYKAKDFINNIVHCQRLLPYKSTCHWSQLGCLDAVEWHRMEDFESILLMPFEDTEVMVMNGYDNVLRECYGDYMQLPPEDQRVGHSDGLTKFYWKN